MAQSRIRKIWLTSGASALKKITTIVFLDVKNLFRKAADEGRDNKPACTARFGSL
jgi:hypothetical protein